jgi:predicted GNAT superfamily acetyltransferase
VSAAASIRIRPLATAEDYAQCVALQRLIWGPGEDIVPAIVLLVSQKVGGIAAGAFDREGTLLGCVVGFTGVRDGRPVHWSHLLAVRPEARDRGIGRRLKRYQRSRLRAMGIQTMYWTFDPLVARNAHLNLVRLGAAVEAYVPDFYAAVAESPVDRAIGTDRLVVRWDLGRAARRRAAGFPAARAIPVVASVPGAGGVAIPVARPLAPARWVRVAIPPDIHGLRDSDAGQASRWRQITRRAFLHYLSRGYRVVSFERRLAEGETSGGWYILAAPRSPGRPRR